MGLEGWPIKIFESHQERVVDIFPNYIEICNDEKLQIV